MKQALGSVRALCLITAMALGLVSCAQVAGPSPAAHSQPVVKLVVNSDGVYEVSAEALQTAGLGLETGSGADLALSAGGEPVSFLIVGEGRERAIRFYGQALGPAAYTANNVYWLCPQPIGSGSGQVQAAIETRSASPATGLEPTSVISFTARAEEQRHYQPDVPSVREQANRSCCRKR